jgi:hypothetical protein
MYEFFLQTRAHEPVLEESHRPPVIYLETVNSGQVADRLTWEEGAAFVRSVASEASRFDELVDRGRFDELAGIVLRHGRRR